MLPSCTRHRPAVASIDSAQSARIIAAAPGARRQALDVALCRIGGWSADHDRRERSEHGLTFGSRRSELTSAPCRHLLVAHQMLRPFKSPLLHDQTNLPHASQRSPWQRKLIHFRQKLPGNAPLCREIGHNKVCHHA